MISRVFDLQSQVFIVVLKTCTFGIGIGHRMLKTTSTPDCDTDTDADSACPAALSG